MNTIKKLFAVVMFFLGLNLHGQTEEAGAFIDFGSEEISKAEFKRVYNKNNSGEMVNKSTIDEYLELYINFKLKVLEAESMGMDTAADFLKELKGYRRQLAQPYMSADNILEELKKEAYERLLQDVKASHVLISVSPDASVADTLIAFNRAQKVKSLLESGQSFKTVAMEYSDDPSAKTNAGELGYFTAFYMIYPFESAAYNTAVGDISNIVRTKYGYHVLKVEDKRNAVGNIKVAHILIANDPELSKTEDPEGKINEIYKQIRTGKKFEELAAQFSDDTRTASQGGMMPMFGVGRMVPEFEEVAFSLKEPGDISEPFETPYGWHIVKLIEKVPIGSYDEVEKELTLRVEKDGRSNLEEGAVLQKIKKDYGFTEDLAKRKVFYTIIDSTYFSPDWQPYKASSLKKTLFTIGDVKVSQKAFAEYINKTQRARKPVDIEILVNQKYDDFVNRKLIGFKDSKLETEYPEFKALMQEYHDGILLFNLTDKLVWSKAVSDSAGLMNYYELNKEKYKWDKRVDAVVFSALNEELANQTKSLIKESDSLNLTNIVDEVNKSSQLNLKYELKKYQKGENESVDQVKWVEGISDNSQKEGRVVFIYIKEVLEPTYKTVDDSRGIITSNYQEFLETEWIKELREKYPFEINQSMLKDLKKELNI